MCKSPYFTLFFFIAFLLACSTSNDNQEEAKSPKIALPDTDNIVKVKSVNVKDFTKDIVSNGTVSAAKSADLKFSQSGILRKIFVKNGQKVIAGQKLASLDQFTYLNEMEQATDQLKKARLELQDVLIGQGYSLEDSISIPKATMELAKVRSGYDNAIIQFKLADYNLKNTVLYAPFSGIIGNLFTQEHNSPETDGTFCTIFGDDSFNVAFTVLENELHLVERNNKIRVFPLSYDDKVAEGKIVEINPVIDKNGMVKIKASISQTGGMKLYEGMNVKVQIEKLLSKQLTIPKQALVLRDNKQVVFTYVNGEAQWNYVVIVGENSSEYLVSEGLREGDLVIYDGNVNLAHEAPVKIVK